MCGIIAFLSQNQKAINYLLRGLTILQNRGYDSAGICTLSEKQKLVLAKYASFQKINALELLQQDSDIFKDHHLGIGHTRWATHGPKTDINAHPHTDSRQRLALVHNGIIENYKKHKQFLTQKGYQFKSETDTEVIAYLIGYHLDNGMEILDAIKKTIGQLEGTWGIAIIYQGTPHKIYLCKKGSPLLVGYEDNFIMVASEYAAISNYVNRYAILKDNEIITLSMENASQELINYEIKEVSQNDQIEMSPDPYPHWMIKEIEEQQHSSLRAMNMGGRFYDNYSVKLGGLNEHRDELLEIKHLLIVACGTSYHAGLLGAKFFRLLECFISVQVIDASEFDKDDIPNDTGIGMLVLSQSGETKDVHRAMQIGRKHNLFMIGIVNVVGSLITRETDCGVYLNAGREVAVASTKSFTSQVIVLVLIAIWFSQQQIQKFKTKRGELIAELNNLPINFGKVFNSLDKVIDPGLIDYLSQKDHIFILGKNFAEPICYEAALKIKEISYIHAEGYPGGALKHGPFALLEKGTPIFICIFNDEHVAKMDIVAEEVKSRGAYVILVSDNPKYNDDLYHNFIQIPNNGYLTSLLGIVPFQYLCYKIGIQNGHNPDFPKNLAKCVTTL